ncbi:energy transducer TonB [uncultured Acetobacteroides sp.]|uniref:energy transducer TonB n=1 Tax=uncultured Acetobacteroides sp. TaxID=1760811 RepID=UPI0029F5408D|nr:energy transducer TonB [uncultured Acetobacteroides sp.]
MEIKKSPVADLENKRSLFLQLGFVMAIGFSLFAFEFDFGEKQDAQNYEAKAVVAEEEIIPQTQQEQQVQQQQPQFVPQQIMSDVLKIVRDEVMVSDEINLNMEDTKEAAPISIPTATTVTAIAAKKEEPIEEEEVFFIAEDMPLFNGKDASDSFREYVAKNLKYPDVAAENGIQGTVYIQFVVEPSGAVSNVKVLRGVDPSLDKEAVRIVQGSPKWTPGKQRGKPVRVSFTFPITFKLN